MLTRLLSRKARREEEEETSADTRPVAAAPSLAAEDALLLFLPMSGGMSFRLFAVEDEEAAAAFVRQEFPHGGAKSLLFRPLRNGTRAGTDEGAEVLVVINDPSRPGTVYLSSFMDMESAQSFMRFEESNGLDPSLVTIHRGVPIPIENAPPSAARPAAPVQTTTTRVVPAAPVQPVTAPQPAATQEPAMAQPVVTAKVALPKTPPLTKAAPTQAAATPRPGIIESIRRWPGWDTLPERIRGAATLKWQIFEEIKGDPIASSQARVIVAAVAVASGIGAFWAGPVAIVIYTVAGLLGWLAGAYLTYWVGAALVAGNRSPESKQLLFNGLALAHAPRVLLIVGILLPWLVPLIVIALLIWAVAAMVPATEYALELDRQSATLTAMTAALAVFAISFVVPALLI